MTGLQKNMWPKYLDMDAKECAGILRKLELEAYSSVVTALRAQGELTKERRKIMNDLSNVLNIPIERHKAEVRRAVNDELLNTIAVSLCGNGQNEAEWAKEGRRIIPLLKRATPITAFTPIADEGSEKLTNLNKSLNSPLNTKSEPKRRCLSPAYAMKYSNRTPPKDLRELVHKVKEEHNEGEPVCVVRSPSIAMPAPSPLVKQHTNYFGGEVVILPSGKAVRLHEDKLNEINEAIDAMNHRKGIASKRKRKPSIDSLENASPTGSHPAFEVLPKNALMNMMPPPPSPHQQKMGLLGQHLISGGSVRGSTPRGRRGAGSRGGRRPKNPRMPVAAASAPTSSTSMGQNNLALLAQAINHQEQQEKANSTPVTETEPSQVAITTPPKVVVVTTPSGTVLRTTSSAASGTPTDTVSSTSTSDIPVTSSQSHVVTTVGSTATTTPVNSTSSSSSMPKVAKIATAATVKLKVGDSPMKVYPVGARILPKTASAGSTAASGSPVFMVATSVSQNLIQRVGQKAAQTVTLSSGQRVVTVNTASLRPGVQQGLKTGSSVITASAIKTLQPRVVSSSGQVNKVSKPSVIVVQRSQSGATKALMTKDIPGATVTGSTVTTTRILQTKPAKQPIVIVSKNSGNQISTENSATVSTTQNSTTPNQNVIVLDLSEQQSVAASPSASTSTPTSTTSSMSNNVLSDILQMTGIMTEEDAAEANQEEEETINEPQKCTTTLQKVPGDSSSWILLDSNGSKNEESIKETAKMDIFSQAMASAEIGDFAENNIQEIKESEPPLVPPKSNSTNANILFASPHDVMPSRQKIEEDMGPIFNENHHDENSVIVEQVGDEIISGEEIVAMDDEFAS